MDYSLYNSSTKHFYFQSFTVTKTRSIFVIFNVSYKCFKKYFEIDFIFFNVSVILCKGFTYHRMILERHNVYKKNTNSQFTI